MTHTERERAKSIEAHRREHEAKIRKRRSAREARADRNKRRGLEAFIKNIAAH